MYMKICKIITHVAWPDDIFFIIVLFLFSICDIISRAFRRSRDLFHDEAYKTQFFLLDAILVTWKAILSMPSTQYTDACIFLKKFKTRCSWDQQKSTILATDY